MELFLLISVGAGVDDDMGDDMGDDFDFNIDDDGALNKVASLHDGISIGIPAPMQLKLFL